MKHCRALIARYVLSSVYRVLGAIVDHNEFYILLL